MKSYLLLAVGFCALFLPSPSNALQQPATETRYESFAGSWEGEMITPRWLTYMNVMLSADEEAAGEIVTMGQTIRLSEPEFDGTTLTVSLVGPWSITPRLHLRFEGSALAGEWQEEDRRFPFRLERGPETGEASGRIERWNQDIDALENRFLRFDRSFGPAERQLFLERTSRTRARLAEMSDDEITMSLAQAVAIGDNAHTRLYLLRRNTRLNRLPVRLWWFGNSLRIISASEEHAGLLGCQVDAISNVPSHHARDRVASAFAGNSAWVDYKSTYYLSSPQALRGLGITASDAPVALRMSQCDVPSVSFAGDRPVERSDEVIEAWRDLFMPGLADGWRHALQGRNVEAPVYLRQMDEHYWYERLPDEDIVYFRLNRTERMAGRDLEEFSEALLAELRSGIPRAFVLDLRFNTGGDGGLFADLMETLDAETTGIPRYVITGRATFSAGILIAARWQEAGNVLFAGEPVGDAIDYWAEGGGIILPNSGIEAHFANGAHFYSPEPCPNDNYCIDLNIAGIAPDFSASLSWSDYIEGRDPALESIVAHLNGESDLN